MLQPHSPLSTSNRAMAEPRTDSPRPSETSATPIAVPAEAQDLYREVLIALNEHATPYAVAGAAALERYTGISRATKDLDVFMEARHISNALRHLEQRGFACEVCDPVWLAKAHRGEYFVDLISGMSNGVITVDECWMNRTQPATIVGILTRIISPEDLVASKLFVTRRERFDGADIAHIIYRTEGRLDWNLLLSLAGEHWEMLLWALILFRYVYPAHTSFVPAWLWQDLLSRYKTLLADPDPAAPFRGSLVDENMFAIDMKDWGLEDVQRRYRDKKLRKTAEVVQCGRRQERAGNQ